MNPNSDACDRPCVVVAVCTYRRNDQLRRLLEHLEASVAQVGDACRVGVVVADDNPGGDARAVVAEFVDRFELGVHHRHSGRQNISAARNLALDAALTIGDWIAMTDDDCVPDPRWLSELTESQRRSGADAVSGRMIRRAPPDSPRWLVDQPFLEQGVARYDTGRELRFASTHNSMVSAQWLRDHPDIRFDDRLGRLGGEDMLFFATAHARGMRITYSAEAIVYEDEPEERLRYRFLLRQAWWLGNSTYVTNIATGTHGRARLAVHGIAVVGRALARPALRVVRGRSPQLRYTAALVAGGLGTVLGAAGVRVDHH